MDIQAISTLVGSVGFPIVAFGMLYFLFKDTLSKNTDAINNNTVVMTRLATKLGEDGDT